MISYPANLPYDALRDQYARSSSGLALLKSQMQSGKIRQRPLFTLRISTIGWQVYFLPVELSVWRDFLTNRLGDGAAEFYMPVWSAAQQDYVNRIVQIKDGAEGVQEKPFADDGYTLVSAMLLVRNL